MNHLVAGIVVAFVVGGATVCHGQEGSGWLAPPRLPPLEEVHPLQEAILPVLIPVVFNNVHELKTMLRGEEFRQLRERWGDRYAIDVAFRWAEQLCWNNRAASLLVIFLATIANRNFGIRVPLFGPILWIPLSGEFSDEFAVRVHLLPAHMFPDSPPGEFGDKDKLQHFFGSAFLAYVFGGAAPAERVGDFIEWGEEAFVVGGTFDVRDLEANNRGRRFSARLREDREALPSMEMTVPLGTPQLADDPANAIEAEEPDTGKHL